MKQNIDVETALVKTPKPHYLVGTATYEQAGNVHTFRGTINFTSEDNPSIETRTTKYLPNPHVNVGDVCFGVWNGVNLMADILKYKTRTLVDEIKVFPKKLVPPDTLLELEVIAIERERKLDRHKKSYELGSIEGRISLNGELLAQVSANYFARK